jgi:HlyD family secretion protein
MRRWIIGIIILAALVVAGTFGITYWRDQQAQAELSNYQTSVIGRGSLTATVGATGTVRSNQSTILIWQTSGTTAEVNVEAGSVASAGQILATLEEESLPQAIILARTDLINAQKALEDLQQSDSARHQAWQTVLQLQQAVIEAERQLDPYEVQDYRDDLDEARKKVVEAEEDLSEAKDDFEPYKEFDADNADRKRYQDLLDDAQEKYDEAVRELSLLQLEEQTARNNLALAQARLTDAEREYERIKDGPNPDDIAALEARIQAAQATLNLAQIQATFDSTVTEVQIKPGDQASAGKVAFRLDDLSKLLVDVRVSEVDINRVTLGQAVSLTFDAIPGQVYNGLVTKIANTGGTSQGVVEFVVTVELSDADERVKPGMTAAVNIVVEELEDVLLVPNRAVRLLDGARVVYLLLNGELEPIRLTLGASSDLESEVLEGNLKSGDVVVLNPPQVFDSNGPPPFVTR